jgi:hypothetical protein
MRGEHSYYKTQIVNIHPIIKTNTHNNNLQLSRNPKQQNKKVGA